MLKSVFPEFKKLEISDKGIIDDFTKNFEPYSDFIFTSVFPWDVNEDVEFTFLNNNLVFKFKDYIDDSHFYMFLGKENCYQTISILLDLSVEKGFERQLKLIPQVVIDNLSEEEKNKLTITNDRDNWDYIIDVKSITEMNGKDFSTMRAKTNKFKRENPNYKLKTLVPSLHYDDIVKVFELWENIVGENHDEEKKCLIRALDNYEELGYLTTGLYLDNKLVGFSMNDIIDDKYAYGFLLKVDYRYSGASEFFIYQTSSDLFNKGIEEINIAQDLNENNLREFKRKLRPSRFLEKYIVA